MRLAALLLIAILFPAVAADACDVPVYRYAILRWEAGQYEVLVFHRGELQGQDKAAVDKLNRSTLSNCSVTELDLSKELDPLDLDLWKSVSSPERPWIVVRYPLDSGLRQIAWSGPLTADSVDHLLVSPARTEISKRLIHGDAAVFVLMESGDTKKDAAVARTLDSTLKRLNNSKDFQSTISVTTPDGDTVPSNEKVRFSMMILSHKDPREQAMLATLHNGNLAEGKMTYPAVYPVFGQGRVLTCLFGKDLCVKTFESVCRFLVSECSCIVKEDNPGVDLLAQVDWSEAGAGGVSDLPKLVSLASLPPKPKAVKLSAKPAKPAARPVPVQSPAKPAAKKPAAAQATKPKVAPAVPASAKPAAPVREAAMAAKASGGLPGGLLMASGGAVLLVALASGLLWWKSSASRRSG